MTDDLVTRLRGWDHCWPAPWLEGAVAEAADRIEALTAERDHAWAMVAEADTRLGQSLADAVRDKADNARLRYALIECADDLEDYVNSEYPISLRDDHESYERGYRRDMEPVVKARAALTGKEPT
jgi:hypothetical protein